MAVLMAASKVEMWDLLQAALMVALMAELMVLKLAVVLVESMVERMAELRVVWKVALKAVRWAGMKVCTRAVRLADTKDEHWVALMD